MTTTFPLSPSGVPVVLPIGLGELTVSPKLDPDQVLPAGPAPVTVFELLLDLLAGDLCFAQAFVATTVPAATAAHYTAQAIAEDPNGATYPFGSYSNTLEDDTHSSGEQFTLGISIGPVRLQPSPPLPPSIVQVTAANAGTWKLRVEIVNDGPDPLTVKAFETAMAATVYR